MYMVGKVLHPWVMSVICLDGIYIINEVHEPILNLTSEEDESVYESSMNGR